MFPFDLSFIPPLETRASILLAALLLDALLGEPDWLWSRVRHPIVAIGNLIGQSDARFNRESDTSNHRRWMGVKTLLALVLAIGAVTLATSAFLQIHPLLSAIEIVIVAIFLAARSLYDHVEAVASALRNSGLEAGRRAVSMIVGRDPDQLDESGVARAAIESTAENFADGVVAPAFWFLVAGLPGIVLYKLINTADSMIGHKTDRHRDFGWAAARVDDIASFIPARLSGAFLVLAAALCGRNARHSLRTMWQDAGKHASPNAGWPETAMAGALEIALAGPRQYAEYRSTDAWLNAEGRRHLDADDISAAIFMMAMATTVMAATTTALFVHLFH